MQSVVCRRITLIKTIVVPKRHTSRACFLQQIEGPELTLYMESLEWIPPYIGRIQSDISEACCESFMASGMTGKYCTYGLGHSSHSSSTAVFNFAKISV